jgi:hypothetical protein
MRRLALLLLVITVLPANALPGDGVRKMFTGVTIDGYGPNPGVGSGILMVLRVAHVTTAQGEKRDFYFIHGGGDFFLTRDGHVYPAPGARCDIWTVTRHISGGPPSIYTGDGGPQDPIGDVIEGIRCWMPPDLS